MTKTFCFLFLIVLFSIQKNYGQAKKTDALYKTILEKDSLLFEVGFNTCDISQFEKLMSDKLEFYHDKDGFSDKAKFLSDIKKGLCFDPQNRQAKRTLEAGSTQIFPLYKNSILYGAIQNGTHLFSENGNPPAGKARFTHLWLLENGSWKLAKSMSFDHQPYQKTEKSLSDDKTIETLLKENNIPALGLGIINNGKLQEIKIYGEIKDGISAPYNTLFNVASLTKPVTAMVALRLISLGKWQLDEPIFNYYTDPEIAHDPRHKKLTTRLILSHQTGFLNWRWMNKDNKLKFEFDPGTKYQYSGEGFEYLRKALEKKFKKPLQQLANELIFQPLKMYDTNYIWDRSTDESRFATGYDKNKKPYETFKNKTPNAADDLHTTIQDYGNFLVSILNEANLSEGIFKEMVQNQVQTKENKYFGLGFEIYDLGENGYAISHGGSDLGTQCLFFLLPKTKQGILIFTNSDVGNKLFEQLLLHYLGEKAKKIVQIEMK